MKNRHIQNFENTQISDAKIPQFKAGDTLKIGIKIIEGEKTRIQFFEGLCISLRGNGVNRTFTLRKLGANNIGVEKIFPLFSKSLDSISVLKIGRVRRAKLYYLRDRKGKAARIKSVVQAKKSEKNEKN